MEPLLRQRGGDNKCHETGTQAIRRQVKPPATRAGVIRPAQGVTAKGATLVATAANAPDVMAGATKSQPTPIRP